MLPVALYWLCEPPISNPVLALLFLAFSTLTALTYLPRFERELGTLKFLVWFQLNVIIIGLLNISIISLCSLVGFWSWRMQEPCVGLWPIIMLAMTMRMFSDSKGNQQASLFGLVAVPMRWYPVVLIGFFSLLSNQIQLELLVALLVGVASQQALDRKQRLHPVLDQFRIPIHWLLPSRARLISLEASFAAACHDAKGKVLSENTATASTSAVYRSLGSFFATALSFCPMCLRTRYISATAATETEPENVTNAFVPFGGKGSRLGEGVV